MSEVIETVPEFNDEQRAYFQQQLAEQSGKPVVYLTPGLMTAAQRADQAHATGDFQALKNDKDARNAFIEKYKSTGYADLQRRWLASEHSRKADEARVKLEERKKRLGIR